MYDNIKTNEFKFPEDVVQWNTPVFSPDSIVIKEGWLWKQGEQFFSFQSLIRANCVYTFEHFNAKMPFQ